MTYYQRPMGDYKTYGYAGDPGFLSGLFKGIKKFAPVILGGLTGGIPGAIVGAMGANGQPKPGPGGGLQTVQGYPVAGSITMPGGTMFRGGAMIPGQGRLPPFTATGPGVLPGGGRGGSMVPSGYHFAKDGSGRLVRNRRMNVANPKALRRAMRRASGFEKLAKRAINFNKRVRPARRKSS